MAQGFVLRCVFIFNYLQIIYFSFLDVLGLGIHHFDERDIFVGPQGPTSTILVPVEIELVPCFGLLPSPRLSL